MLYDDFMLQRYSEKVRIVILKKCDLLVTACIERVMSRVIPIIREGTLRFFSLAGKLRELPTRIGPLSQRMRAAASEASSDGSFATSSDPSEELRHGAYQEG